MMTRRVDVEDRAVAPSEPGKPAAAKTRTPANSAAAVETRQKILDAVRTTLLTEGLAGASARAIARHGDFNQALIFYHFGSVDGLLQAVAREDSARRAALYADELAQVSTLAELVEVGRRIHDVETDEGSTATLAQLLAGATASPGLREALQDGTRSWTVLVEGAVQRVLAPTAMASLVPAEDLAFAIASLFLGMELVAGLDEDPGRVDALFASLGPVVQLIDTMLRNTSP